MNIDQKRMHFEDMRKTFEHRRAYYVQNNFVLCPRQLPIFGIIYLRVQRTMAVLIKRKICENNPFIYHFLRATIFHNFSGNLTSQNFIFLREIILPYFPVLIHRFFVLTHLNSHVSSLSQSFEEKNGGEKPYTYAASIEKVVYVNPEIDGSMRETGCQRLENRVRLYFAN